MKYKLIIFDLDGTILDTLDDLTNSTNYALHYYGYKERTKEEIRSFVGNGIRKLIERALPQDVTEEEISKVFDTFTGFYILHCMDATKPYDGIVQVIRKLREAGYLTAVVSNKADRAVQELCNTFFKGLFDFVVGEREGIKRKPSPDSCLETLRILEVKKDETLYVGDSEVDIETAGNAMIDILSVTWGFRDKESLAIKGAVHIAEEPIQILKFLRFMV